MLRRWIVFAWSNVALWRNYKLLWSRQWTFWFRKGRRVTSLADWLLPSRISLSHVLWQTAMQRAIQLQEKLEWWGFFFQRKSLVFRICSSLWNEFKFPKAGFEVWCDFKVFEDLALKRSIKQSVTVLLIFIWDHLLEIYENKEFCWVWKLYK